MQSATAVIRAIDKTKNDVILIGITKKRKMVFIRRSS
ncbi:hypothetical protein [Listeria riparia]|nr:hypothetical protein [Listeria riparia]